MQFVFVVFCNITFCPKKHCITCIKVFFTQQMYSILQSVNSSYYNHFTITNSQRQN